MTQFECKNECDKDLVDEGFFCTGKGISSVIEGKLEKTLGPPLHAFLPNEIVLYLQTSEIYF